MCILDWKPRKVFGALGILIFAAQIVMGQASKIPPRYVDEWFGQRLLPSVIAGAVAGLLAALVWLPRLLPQPHSNDILRARLHALCALLGSIFVILGLLLVDISNLAQFGRQTYSLSDLVSNVLFSSQSIKLLGIAVVSFAIVFIVWIRFVSNKFYRYMIIP